MKSSSIKFVLIFSLIALVASCKVEPKEIEYGQDHCHFCDMTVVDKSHAAEYVTQKGKSYVFDAIECMVNEILRDKNEPELAFILVADYAEPGKLVDAKTATYLISENIKSPMGANLSAFASREIAEKFQKENGGILLNWDELKAKFAK